MQTDRERAEAELELLAQVGIDSKDGILDAMLEYAAQEVESMGRILAHTYRARRRGAELRAQKSGPCGTGGEG